MLVKIKSILLKFDARWLSTYFIRIKMLFLWARTDASVWLQRSQLRLVILALTVQYILLSLCGNFALWYPHLWSVMRALWRVHWRRPDSWMPQSVRQADLSIWNKPTKYTSAHQSQCIWSPLRFCALSSLPCCSKFAANWDMRNMRAVCSTRCV